MRPDIGARKERQRVLVEVETPRTKDRGCAKRQQRAFEGAAKRSERTRFETIAMRKK